MLGHSSVIPVLSPHNVLCDSLNIGVLLVNSNPEFQKGQGAENPGLFWACRDFWNFSRFFIVAPFL